VILATGSQDAEEGQQDWELDEQQQAQGIKDAPFPARRRIQIEQR